MAKYRGRIPYKLCKNQVLNVFMAFAGCKGTKSTVAQFGGKTELSGPCQDRGQDATFCTSRDYIGGSESAQVVTRLINLLYY